MNKELRNIGKVTALGLAALVGACSPIYKEATVVDVKEERDKNGDGVERQAGIVKVKNADGSTKVYSTPWETVKCPQKMFVECEVSRSQLFYKLEVAKTLNHPVYLRTDFWDNTIIGVSDE